MSILCFALITSGCTTINSDSFSAGKESGASYKKLAPSKASDEVIKGVTMLIGVPVMLVVLGTVIGAFAEKCSSKYVNCK